LTSIARDGFYVVRGEFNFQLVTASRVLLLARSFHTQKLWYILFRNIALRWCAFGILVHPGEDSKGFFEISRGSRLGAVKALF